MSTSKQVVAIIGGGFCGLMTAVQLKSLSRKSLHILLFDPSADPGRGIAYSGYSASHLLNVEARNMSALPEDADHFLHWISSHHADRFPTPADAARAFLPRVWYGEYLNHFAKTLKQDSGNPNTCSFIQSKVDGLLKTEEGFSLHTEDGNRYNADAVVLATGNFLPSKPKGIPNDFTFSQHYYGNPWVEECVAGCSGEEPVLIAGTGLTMVDVVQGLREKGFAGKIIAVSPKGFEILPHRHYDISIDLEKDITLPISLSRLFAIFKKHIRNVRSQGITGEAVVDAIRPKTQLIWKSLDQEERNRFLAHVRHLWGLARHRLPPGLHQDLRSQMDSDKLHILAARIIDAHDEGTRSIVTLRKRKSGLLQEIAVQRIINCTGPATDISKTENPLFQSLLHQGLIKADGLKMGIVCDDDYRILSGSGSPVGCFYALGSLLKGLLWESTAVPELRVQARDIARTIIDDLST